MSIGDRVKIITDEAIAGGTLGFGNYSKVLANIVENSRPQFATGIFGGWGTGKNTLMNMTKGMLDRNEKIFTVWFDA